MNKLQVHTWSELLVPLVNMMKESDFKKRARAVKIPISTMEIIKDFQST